MKTVSAKKQGWNKKMKQASVLGSLFLFAACGGAAGESTTDTVAATSLFPQDLAVASPTDMVADEGTTNLTLSSVKLLGSPALVPHYALLTAEINSILNSGSVAMCKFDPELFLTKEEDADCYGPMVAYESHPDTTASDPLFDGSLPPGDLGLWEETDAATGHACSAAELNARMSGVRDKSFASLTGLASMVCVINASGYSMPSSSTLNLLTEMTALGIPNVTFTAAEISHVIDGSGLDQYSYQLEFEYTPASVTYDVVVDMQHTPGASALEYAGQLSYLVNDQNPLGNCPTSDVTVNGSLQYERNGLDDMDVQVRSAEFCSHGADGRDAANLVDPAQKYDAATNPDGWGNTFSILTANYDPTTLLGNYAYAWQAGPADDNARIFNMLIEDDGGVNHGLAFFGYGDDIATTDGSIQGFICNWYGPNFSHALVDYSQFQEVEYDSASGTFASVASNIEYAPTVACDYDGTGSFIYDTNGDGTLTDEIHAPVVQDLFPAVDVDGDGIATMVETIDATGFSLPTI